MERRYIKSMAADRGEALGDVAKTLGITQATLSTIIAGASISPDLAKKIAAWHGTVTPAEVLWGNETE